MPGTTRYSATFDRTYEEDDRVAPEPVTTRRSRSLSWQANCGTDGRPYTPLAGMRPSQRSSSTDNGPSQAAANIPTRTVANTAVKAHNNPFQFVKVGTCPLYKKAEEQLKKVKEVKKPEVLKEEEEEWQSNLDSWKSRRRKMSEDVFRRQEEIRQLELDEQIAQANQKKTKTFSEMVESRAHRGRALSLCLISSPLELQNWEFENKSILKSHFSGGSEGNSTVNSEDEGVNLKGISLSDRVDGQDPDHKVNGDAHIMNNGSVTDSIRNGNNKFSTIDSNNLSSVHKEGTYIDSGLESISSSHRAGDTPDSGSDFSQDSGSSMDCESPRISGVNLLEDYNGKSMPIIEGDNLLKKKSDGADKLCGLSAGSGNIGGKINGEPVSENGELKGSSKMNSSKTDSGKATKENIKTTAEVHKSISQVSNHKKTENNANVPGIPPQQHEKSIESENEMYVDDFDDLSKLSIPSVQRPGVGSSKIQEKEAVSCIKSSDDLIKKSESPKSGTKVMKPLDSSKSISKESNVSSDSIKKMDSSKSVTKAPDSTKKSDFAKSVSKEMKSPSESVKKSDSSKSVSKEVKAPSESVKKSDSSKSISKDMKASAAPVKKSDSSKSVSKDMKAPSESVKKSDSSKSVAKASDSIRKSDSSKSVTKASDSIKKSDSSKSISKEVKAPVDSSIKPADNFPAENASVNLPAETLLTETKSKLDSPEDKAKPVSGKKKVKAKVPKKKITSTTQKTNSSDEKEVTVVKNQSQDSLNIVFESQSVSKKNSSDACNGVIQTSSNSEQTELLSLKSDIPPVEKVAEEMEKLILEQLEEEERAKEIAAEMQVKSTIGPTEHLIAPPRQVEPPKEKPPPPPTSSNETPKQSGSLKRVNSTKRIKKEIHKRRSDFLGIENSEENVACGESAIPPPPALEEILKAEMELDRESRRKLESAADQRLTLEEKEIIQKEREIIETLESEERQKHLTNNCEDVADKQSENDRIQLLKEERKRMEEERLLNEEQRLRLIEEKQLREREEYIKKQEDGNSPTVQLSAPLLSVAANKFNAEKPSVASPVSNEKKSNITSESSGEGTNILSNSSSQIPDEKCNEVENKTSVPVKPVVPPKPLKKKEAIRKERERLRQEQEALQREREEHRRKLMLEQEELMKNQQKSHAPDAPATRLGTLPPLVKPSLTSQLTTPLSASPNARENATFTSRSHHGAQNGVVGSIGSVEPTCHPVNRQTRIVSSRGKTAQNEAWGQQKVPSVRKQNQDSLTESRYNQNHWLIQEAEMRRITELKERQRANQIPYPQTHLAEDDVCSTSPRVPVLSPNTSQHMNYSPAEKHWNYAQPNVAIKNYPPAPVKSEKPLPVYPRESVSHPPSKPSRVVPMERQEQMLSVSGRKRCSHCNEELGRGAAMIIESLQLYYHIHCFQCCVCQAQLGNGSCGTDVRVRNNKLHCHNCYSNDEAGLKFSQV